MFNNVNESKSFPKGVELKADAAINGLRFHLPAGVTELTVGTVTYKVADLIQVAEQLVKPWKDARTSHAIIRQVMESRPEDEPKLRAFLKDLHYAMGCVVGRESEELRNFGFTPERRRKDLTPEEKVQRAEKAKLTRQLRHTMGPKQKATIKASSAQPHAPNGGSSAGPTNGGTVA